MEYRLELEEYEGQKMLHVYMSGPMQEKECVNMCKDSTGTGRENNINMLFFDVREADLSHPLITATRRFRIYQSLA